MPEKKKLPPFDDLSDAERRKKAKDADIETEKVKKKKTSPSKTPERLGHVPKDEVCCQTFFGQIRIIGPEGEDDNCVCLSLEQGQILLGKLPKVLEELKKAEKEKLEKNIKDLEKKLEALK